MIYFVVIVALFLCTFVSFPSMIQFGVSTDSLWNSFTYPFLHASWLHFVLNAVAALILIRPINKLYILRYDENPYIVHNLAYFAAVLAGAACAVEIPTVGMSGCVFFLLGVLLMLNPTKRQAMNYLWLVAASTIQLYFGKTNVALHAFAFIEGCVFICVRDFLYQYKNGTGLFEPVENADA